MGLGGLSCDVDRDICLSAPLSLSIRAICFEASPSFSNILSHAWPDVSSSRDISRIWEEQCLLPSIAKFTVDRLSKTTLFQCLHVSNHSLETRADAARVYMQIRYASIKSRPLLLAL